MVIICKCGVFTDCKYFTVRDEEVFPTPASLTEIDLSPNLNKKFSIKSKLICVKNINRLWYKMQRFQRLQQVTRTLTLVF